MSLLVVLKKREDLGTGLGCIPKERFSESQGSVRRKSSLGKYSQNSGGIPDEGSYSTSMGLGGSTTSSSSAMIDCLLVGATALLLLLSLLLSLLLLLLLWVEADSIFYT